MNLPFWNSLGLQNSVSPLMEQLIYFHDHTMIVLISIVSLVGYMMFSVLFSSLYSRILEHSQWIEIIWTILPAFILVFVAFPSLRLLYLLDEVDNPSMTLKVTGHQWYWSYEYSDFLNKEIDSYMVPKEEMVSSSFRLLDVDNRTVLPMLTQIRLLVTAADVIHSWTVPVLGVKVDAVPGRLNQTSFMITRPGLFYGQCSEICGANHSFMPISIESVDMGSFLSWVSLE
uniref:Cytochrome c oxidase subunit 2 n=1 Tax=Eophreatoicus karrkkanj TaxID=496899 RepID=D3U704_9CRUS|nr:cytochrome c oxidase subunit II [Eophreatoicus sp. 14 FK-2009]ACN72762.1 cytochrome c oxidase subunit II [Eophreatoicus karrkkanj]